MSTEIDPIEPVVEEIEDTELEDEGDSLLDKIARFNEHNGVEVEPETEQVEEETVEEETPAVEEDPVVEEEEPAPTPEPDKKVQTKEENAKFAEQRRQAQLEASPEYQLARELANMYGTTPENMLTQIKQAALERQSVERGVPIEFLQQQQSMQDQIAQMQQHQQNLEFQNWQNRIDREAIDVKKAYPFLSDEQVNEATEFMLATVRNPELPLKQAIMAVHGDLIAEQLKKAAEQEAIAKVSGRKPSPVTPSGSGKSKSPSATLTPEERYVAKQMGMTPEEYVKYRDM